MAKASKKRSVPLRDAKHAVGKQAKQVARNKNKRVSRTQSANAREALDNLQVQAIYTTKTLDHAEASTLQALKPSEEAIHGLAEHMGANSL
ncbi:hypothetical protein PLICRDRAFT_37144 [Plicaturopsis crispa FD-325 SS-3]|nr:hypothetical protein PLICRDRAFT_37144 [Plicaturopsis crispa FD-325 SS-3]